MEAYSRRENIKFMNVKEETTVDGKEDTEEVLDLFWSATWATLMPEVRKFNGFIDMEKMVNRVLSSLAF